MNDSSSDSSVSSSSSTSSSSYESSTASSSSSDDTDDDYNDVHPPFSITGVKKAPLKLEVEFLASPVGQKVHNVTLLYNHEDSESVVATWPPASMPPAVLPAEAVMQDAFTVKQLVDELLNLRLVKPLTYRAVDYLCSAVQIFIIILKREYKMQYARSSHSQRRVHKFRFLWSEGTLNDMLATVCDCSKTLCALLQVQVFVSMRVSRASVSLDLFNKALFYNMYRASGISQDELPLEEYERRAGKFLFNVSSDRDVEEGSLEVRQTHDERIKTLEHFIKFSTEEQERTILRTGAPRTMNGQTEALPSSHVFLSLTHLLGETRLLAFPETRLEAMPAFVDLMRVHEPRSVAPFCVRFLASTSSAVVMQAFERNNGLQLVRSWALEAARGRDVSLLSLLVRFVVRNYKFYSAETRRAWLAPLQANSSETWSSTIACLQSAVEGREDILKDLEDLNTDLRNDGDAASNTADERRDEVKDSFANAEWDAIETEIHSHRIELMKQIGWGNIGASDLPLLVRPLDIDSYIIVKEENRQYD